MQVGNLNKEVVVTGIGVVTPLDNGKGVGSFWDGACRGVNTVRPITRFDVKGHQCGVGAEIEGLMDLHDGISKNDTDPSFRIMSLACKYAVDDALLEGDSLENAGVAVGTILGGITSAERYWGARFFSMEERRDDFFREYCLDSVANHVVKRFSLRGPSFSLSTACCSGADAIRTAATQISNGRISVMLAGGVDVLSEFVFRGFSALNAMTTDGLVKPFDKNRRGLALGEGAGVLVLEDRFHAESRKARIYCSLIGAGTSSDASHIVKPNRDGEGLARAISQALMNAKVQGELIDFVCAHGTGTSYNDTMETKAIKRGLGQMAKKIKVTSMKSMIGHTLGAAAAIEAVTCVKAMETGTIPPTINYQLPDQECDLDYVVNKQYKHSIDVCMSLSAGFGGQNTALIFKRHK